MNSDPKTLIAIFTPSSVSNWKLPWSIFSYTLIGKLNSCETKSLNILTPGSSPPFLRPFAAVDLTCAQGLVYPMGPLEYSLNLRDNVISDVKFVH